ncbi:hypothetical protein Tsubulata_013433 [Turnera subulata]|uniref:anthocyanidin 3-O-glucosyltransferase n=1 Tax=Turnera subulata TaxID=218843 RepID=A0A9Q0FRP7_9ROSI|nr:hypothetical protein Tsubulata_013433 [Turnera subulata]
MTPIHSVCVASPHVLIFPFPAQGHVNSMLKLAELLGIAGLNVTFLNSEYNHERLVRYTDIQERFAPYTGLRFRTISDGLPADHPRTGGRVMELFEALKLQSKTHFKDILVGIRPRVTCIIGDGNMGFVVEVASELGIPLIHFRTISACCFWAYFSLPQAIEAGELPIQGHVNSMLKLAQLLGIAGLNVTFLNSEYNHERLVRHTKIQERFAEYPGFHFRTIPDGLPADHPRSGHTATDIFESLGTRSKLIFKDMLVEIRPRSKPIFKETLVEIRPRVTCIIGDGLMGLVVEGHINPMLKLAELLNLSGLNVTFLNSERAHERLVRFADIQSRFNIDSPGFHLKTIPDGLPAELPPNLQFMDLYRAIDVTTRRILKEMLIDRSTPPVSCVIADRILGFVLDVALEVGIPIIVFRTFSACCFWAYFSVPEIIQAKRLPIQGNEDMDRPITKVPGMESFLRFRDLPSFCRSTDMKDPSLQLVIRETQQSTRAQALILNTFEDLEAPILHHIRTKCPKTYTIGPLHLLLNTQLSLKNSQEASSIPQYSNSLWKVDRSCIEWLDRQPSRSVLYVSFGSITILTRDQFLEFWYGIVSSKKRFLWVIRPGSVKKDGNLENFPVELEEATKERGYMVEWAPQEEVLAHNAIGGFFTHSGWNSTLESMVAGVPMICWPFFADQQVNSRFVSEVWKLGLDMKDVCDRKIVEKMVNDLMVERKEELFASATRMAQLARQSLLGIAGLDITFLNSEYNHERLVRHTNIQERFAQYPGFHFRTIPDGLPADHPRSGVALKELFESLNTRVKPILKEMLAEIRPRVTCIIGDGFMGFVVEVASELGIPIISFRTSGACSLGVYLSLPQVIEAGELDIQAELSNLVFNVTFLNSEWTLDRLVCFFFSDIQSRFVHYPGFHLKTIYIYLMIAGNEDMDRPITKVPGMEGFLRYRDLPSFCRSTDMEDPSLQLVLTQTRQSTRAQALIMNTFEDLEGPILNRIRSKYPKTYPIGPLHQLLNTQLSMKKSQESSSIPHYSNSLWKVDRSSIEWLDRQPSSSKKRFLWVIRPDSVKKDGNLEDFPVELEEATKERGYMVEWAPQEEVLAHKAICGFFTHSGWNSNLESIVAGVPMICWPFFGDQQVNSRFVSEVWKVGLDMKDACGRKIVEKMVNDLMVERREELFASATRMAQLARQSLLAIAGLNVTFLNSEHNHERLVRHTNIQERFAQYPGFRFRTIPDGVPADHPRSGAAVLDMFVSIERRSKPIFKDMLVEIRPRVTCIIGDGRMGFVVEVASELGISVIHARCISPCCFWTYFSLPQIIEAGELVIQGNEDMDRPITKVPGMESFLRYRDLPSFCRSTDMEDPCLQLNIKETLSTQGQALILNTFEDLEAPILNHIRTKCPNIYTIGPLHQLLNTKLSMKKSQESSIPHYSNSLWQVDRSCIEWLDRQPSRSVLYISFGSLTILTRDQFLEFWYGIVSSRKRFLWVIRPDSVKKDGDLEDFPVELEEATKERGCMVGWAPQEEVLVHKAIGGFFTHTGWNSTLESIVAGVPMICWPFFADQQLNSRFVSEVWKLGLDMKDVCDRKIVEKMVNDLMVERREELSASATRMAQLARQSVSEEGSSFCNLSRLIEDIRLMSLQAHDHAQNGLASLCYVAGMYCFLS